MSLPQLDPGRTQCDPGRPLKGRFAPSPSGRMHLGNIFTALMSWLSVKSRGGKWVLRIEDLDPQRSKPHFARIIEDDLQWLGLEWDEGGIDGPGREGPYLQSLRGGIYEEEFRYLERTGLVYPCRCTRNEILATNAPHESDGRVIYNGRCRRGHPDLSLPVRAWRIEVPDEEICFTDGICGPQHVNLATQCGDFVLRRGDGAWAYQLAVVADDAMMGISEVVRGRDLLLSAAQQIFLYRLLGFQAPVFVHLPLICNSGGLRLSKRDYSCGMEELRKVHSPESLIGLVASVAGLIGKPEPLSPVDLIPLFSYDKLKKLPDYIILP